MKCDDTCNQLTAQIEKQSSTCLIHYSVVVIKKLCTRCTEITFYPKWWARALCILTAREQEQRLI